MDYKTRWLLLGVLCLAFLVTAACKRTDWESNNAAGLKALQQGRYAEAEPLYKRSLAILEKARGPEHPNVATGLGNYDVLLRKTNREAKAEKSEVRAKAIWVIHEQKNPAK